MHYSWVLLLAVLAATAVRAQSGFPFFEPVSPPRQVQVMVHRGMRMLAPENSVQAILACAGDYLEWAEIDLRLTRDGNHVIIHDPTLDRCTNGKGPVADKTLAELQIFDAGSWFGPGFTKTRLAGFSEVLQAAKGKVNLYLDCKSIDPSLLTRQIREARMERQVLVFGPPEVLVRVRAISGDSIATMAKFRAGMDFSRFVRDVNPAAVEIDANDITPELSKAFRAKGIKVQAKVIGPVWDNPEVWGRMIDAKVDWLQTDDPAGVRFYEARKRLGKFPVKIAYHRGANRYAPENTLQAIREASRLGADYIEVDIRTTSDNQAVLMHDSKLDRTTLTHGTVSGTEFSSLRRLSGGAWFCKAYAGEKIPTLEEALAALGKGPGAYLDAKAISPGMLASAIRKAGLLERHVVYQSLDYCGKLKALAPGARLMPPLGALKDLPHVAEIQPYAVDANWKILSPEMISTCQSRGIQVFSDALGRHENLEEYRKAISWKIDCIQTDFPLRILRAIELFMEDKGQPQGKHKGSADCRDFRRHWGVAAGFDHQGRQGEDRLFNRSRGRTRTA